MPSLYRLATRGYYPDPVLDHQSEGSKDFALSRSWSTSLLLPTNPRHPGSLPLLGTIDLLQSRIRTRRVDPSLKPRYPTTISYP